MTDNVDVTPGTGATIATDDVGGVQYQRVKVDLGGDGAGSPLVRGAQTAANSLPVTIATNDPLVTILGGAFGLSLDDATTTGAGSVIGGGTTLLVEHSMRVTHASAATLVVALQGLLDDWVTIGNWDLGGGYASGDVLRVTYPCKQTRANITTISGGGATVDAYIASR